MVEPLLPAELPIPAETLLDELNLLVALLSTDGTILYVNAEVLRRTGQLYGDVVGKQFARMPWWTYREGQSKLIREALEFALQARSSHIELEAEIDPSHRMLVEFELRPLRAENGTIVAIAAQGHDVTERRAAEREQQEAQFRWRTIADFTIDWELWLHPAGHVLYSSPASQRTTGYVASDFVDGKVTLTQLAYKDDRKRVSALLTEAFSGTTGHSRRWRIVRKDGELRWTSCSWQTVHDDEGKSMGVRFSVRDVTELHDAEDEQERLLAAYRTLARHFPRGLVALLDRDLKLVVCDGPAFAKLPVDGQAIVGKRLPEVLDPAWLAMVQPVIDTAMGGTEVAQLVRVGDGNWLVHLTPIHDDQGRVAHLIASAVKELDVWADSEELPTEQRH